MNKLLLTSLVLFLFSQNIFAQSTAVITNNGAADELKATPPEFLNLVTEGESIKFEFRSLSSTSAEMENGIDFFIEASIVSAGNKPKIIANSKKVKKTFKPGEVYYPNQIFGKDVLLFSNATTSKMTPGQYRLVFSMSVANLSERSKYKTALRAFDFVWR